MAGWLVVRRFPAIAAALFALSTSLGVVAPVSRVDAAEPPRAERVLVFSLPAVSWSDLGRTPLPNLDAFFEGAGLAVLSTRGVARRTSPEDGYATLGAGARVAGVAEGSLAYEADESFGVDTAQDFAERVQGRVVEGDLLNLGFPALLDENDGLDYGAQPGLLGASLASAGLSTTVVANADDDRFRPILRRAPATLALMDGDGTVASGALGPALLEADPTRVGAVRLAIDPVVQEFAAGWDRGGVVLVEAGDLARWGRERSFPAQQDELQQDELQQDRLRLLESLVAADELFGRLLASVDLERDAVLVVGPYHRSGPAHLTVAAAAGPGFEAGLLRSATTRRSGVVAITDVAPTVLDVLGLPVPSAMEGTPWRMGRADGAIVDRRDALAEVDEQATWRGRHLGRAIGVYLGVQVAICAFALVALRRPRGPVVAALLRISGLVTIVYLPITYLATLLPTRLWSSGPYWVTVAGSSVMVAVLLWAGTRRSRVAGLAPALGLAAGVMAFDVLSGSSLQFNAVFGYSPVVGGRFAGFGNLGFALFAVSVLGLAGLAVRYDLLGRGRAVATVLLTAAIVLVGSPIWGADVGGVLALVPAAATMLWLLSEQRLRASRLVLWSFVAILAVVAFGLVDLTRPEDSQTHLGRLLSSMGTDGLGPLLDVVTRKLDSSLRTVTNSTWTYLIPVVVGFVTIVRWRFPSAVRDAAIAFGPARATAAGVAVLAVLGFAWNDSGTAVTAVVLGVANGAFVFLLAPRTESTGGRPPSDTAVDLTVGRVEERDVLAGSR